jgi:hypothetical protein
VFSKVTESPPSETKATRLPSPEMLGWSALPEIGRRSGLTDSRMVVPVEPEDVVQDLVLAGDVGARDEGHVPAGARHARLARAARGLVLERP